MSTTDEAPATWLTQDAHDRLKAELDELIANRSAVSQEIHSRREEGDLKENGGYHAAKEEQGKQEARIRQLGDLLRSATVGNPPKTADAVAPGIVVTVHFDGDVGDTETFLLGSREIAATTDITVYSPGSALGAAILGHKTGDTVTYTTPAGASISATVVDLQPFHG